jgi:hypothetical protein
VCDSYGARRCQRNSLELSLGKVWELVAYFLLTVVGASSTADAWAADFMPTKASPVPTDLAAAPPRACIYLSDFITNNCGLAWHGVTLFGIVD